MQFICVFSPLHRRFPRQKECELICHSRSTENPTVGTVLQRTRLFSPTGDTELLRSRCLAPPASASKKGKADETTRSGLPAPEAWRDGHANRAPCHLAALGAVPVCGVLFRVEKIVKEEVLEVSRLWSICKNTSRGFALPILERMVVDAATVSFCCLCDPQHLTHCTAHPST